MSGSATGEGLNGARSGALFVALALACVLGLGLSPPGPPSTALAQEAAAVDAAAGESAAASDAAAPSEEAAATADSPAEDSSAAAGGDATGGEAAGDATSVDASAAAPSLGPPSDVSLSTPAPEAEGVIRLPGIVFWLVVAGTFILPVWLGNYCAKAFRLPEHGWRIALILFATLASSVICTFRWPPKLGIDLRGGTILVYEIDQSKLEPGKTVDLQELAGVIKKRLDPGGVKEIVVRAYGAQQVQVIIPEASPSETERVQRLISQTGALEFRVTASLNKQDHLDLIQRATQSAALEVRSGDGKVLARWVPVNTERTGEFLNNSRYISRVSAAGELQVLVVIDANNVTGSYLDAASSSVDPQGGYKVNFVFDAPGSKRFGKLTFDNKPDQQGNEFYIGIVLDGYLYSAPAIRSAIYGSGEITGGFSQEEARDLATVLTAGALPTALYKEPSSLQESGATLGQDTIRSGVLSMLVASGLVVLFMLVYYRFAGVVANLALLLNVLLVVAFMILFNAAFTLSGLAGLALTVGMAVDANVLIYERMREETGRGASLRMAIRNGFDRATSTIVDANVTTLITAVVLYVIGTDQVKGFAITLILGLLTNMFTAVFCSRVLFDLAERNRWVTQLKMGKMFSAPNFDYLRWRRVAVAGSALVIGLGLVACYIRGQGLLDIDFTGGVSIQALFQEPQEIDEVREKVADLPDVTVQQVRVAGEADGYRFVINTSKPGIKDVEQELVRTFGAALAVNQMTIEEVAAYEPPPPPPTEASTGPALTIPEATTPEATTPEATTPEETTPEETTPEETTPEETTPEETTPEDAAPAMPEGDAAEATSEPQSGLSPRADRLLALSLVRFQDPEAPPVADDAAPADDAAVEGDPAAAAGEAPVEEAAQEDAPTTDEDSGETEPSDAAPSDAPPSDAPSPGDAPAEAAVEAPVEPSPTLPVAPAAGPSREPAFPPIAPATEEPAAPDPFAGGTIARLSFAGVAEGQAGVSTGIDYQSLKQAIDDVFTDPATAEDRVAYVLENPAYAAGESRPFTEWTLKIALTPERTQKVLERVQALLAGQPYFPASNAIGKTVAGETQQQALVAILLSLGLILIYVWYRFHQASFGFAAVVAVFHDVLVTLGALAVSYWLADYLGVLKVEPFKISLPIIAAFLTIIGFSLNDTIVIFDRVREIRGKSPLVTAELVNRSVNQTLSRTILTSLTVFIVALILYWFGGAGIHAFAFALVIGVMTGTYSTVFVATPIVVWLQKSPPQQPGGRAPTGRVPAKA